ncbi:HNH endonuclease (fragment) [Candidatus Desulfosporosinus infrequens]|uniref:HNH endonuclease n=1 Tax=Candidatus Desulfosporosinus infrequens TaxID=2043169 RepID=A0A2U3LXK8_9FIRM
MNELEIKFIEKFCDKYSPESKGEDILSRIDRIDGKIKNIFLGIRMLRDKAEHDFKDMMED